MLGNKNQNSSLNQRSVVNGITKALKDLIAVIEKENASLKVGKISDIGMVVELKVEAISKFNEAEYDVEDYVKAGGQFDQNSSSMKKVKELFSKLDVVKKDNEIFIRSNLEVSDQMIEMYKEHKTQETTRQYGYNKDGSISPEKVKNAMPSVGLNNKV
jgi:flagellar biosynthesis/type III secretory pathway chaperone